MKTKEYIHLQISLKERFLCVKVIVKWKIYLWKLRNEDQEIFIHRSQCVSAVAVGLLWGTENTTRDANPL